MSPGTIDKSGFARLTAYNIAANLTVPLASLVDTAMLGRLPQISALAGVALAAVIFDYVYWGFGFLRMGTTGLTAKALGAGDNDESHRVLIRSLVLGLGLGFLLLVLHPLLREGGFSLLAGAAEVETAGRAYFNSRILGAPLTLANFALLGWFLGNSKGRTVLWVVAAGNIANVVLDYWLILRLGLGPAGAGAATAIAQAIQFVVAIAFLPAGTLPRAVRDRATIFLWSKLTGFLRLNRDLLLRTVLLVSAFSVFQNASAYLGTNTLAANAILLHLLALAAYWIDGVAFATEVYAGRAEGAGDPSALRSTLGLAIRSSFFFALVFSLAYLLFRRPLLGLISTHEPVIDLASQFVLWLAITITMGSVAYALDGFFLGLTRAKLLRNAMAWSFFLGFLPLVALGAYHSNNRLLWAGLVTFMIARTVTLGVPALRLLAKRGD